MAQRELELATLRAELRAFEQQYLRIVGVRFADIDALEAQIAEALHRLRPSEETRQRVTESRAIAAESAAGAGAIERQQPAVEFKPSDELKRLYREIAKCVHPDLATDDRERAKRNQIMADVNRAYAEGDEQRLRAILDEWDTSPDTVTGDGIGAELVRTIRKIHQLETRLAAIDVEIAALNDSEWAVLLAKAEVERGHGRDLLAQMAEQLDSQLVALRQRRDALTSSGATA